jgi:hypothetical protein
VYAFLKLNISNKFKIKLYARYIRDLHFTCILRLLSFLNRALNSDFSLTVYNINFNIKNSLLYYKPLSGAPRLYILNIYIKTLLFIIHDKNYFSFDYTYNKLYSFCILSLTKKVLEYIKYYLSYLLNTMLRTCLNKALYPIIIILILFYTIIINFILALLNILLYLL